MEVKLRQHERVLVPLLMDGSEAVVWREKERSRIRFINGYP